MGKKARKLVAFVVIGMLGVAGLAWGVSGIILDYLGGQKVNLTRVNVANALFSIVAGIRTSDSLVVPVRLNGTRDLMVDDAWRDRDMVWQYTPALQTKLYLWNQAGLGVDSTPVLNIRGWNRVSATLLVTAKDSLAVKLLLFGLQIRGHYTQSGDSISTYPWRRYHGIANTTALNDTLGSTTLPDTIVDGKAAQDEILIPIWVNGTAPRGRSFTIMDRTTGDDFAFDYMSGRLRMVAAYAGNLGIMTANQASALVTLSFRGGR